MLRTFPINVIVERSADGLMWERLSTEATRFIFHELGNMHELRDDMCYPDSPTRLGVVGVVYSFDDYPKQQIVTTVVEIIERGGVAVVRMALGAECHLRAAPSEAQPFTAGVDYHRTAGRAPYIRTVSDS